MAANTVNGLSPSPSQGSPTQESLLSFESTTDKMKQIFSKYLDPYLQNTLCANVFKLIGGNDFKKSCFAYANAKDNYLVSELQQLPVKDREFNYMQYDSAYLELRSYLKPLSTALADPEKAIDRMSFLQRVSLRAAYAALSGQIDKIGQSATELVLQISRL